MNTLIKSLKYFWRRIIYGGSTSLKLYEQFVLKCVEDALPEDEGNILQKQLFNLEMVQRSPGMRISRIFLNPDSSYPLFHCKNSAHCVARLKISGESRSVVVEVFRHKGEIASLEFHGSPEKLGNGALKLLDISLNPDALNISMAEVITRFGHGKNSD